MTGGAAKYSGKRMSKALNAKVDEIRKEERKQREQNQKRGMEQEQAALMRLAVQKGSFFFSCRSLPSPLKRERHTHTKKGR